MKLNLLSGDKGLYFGIASAKRSCVPNERDPNAFRMVLPVATSEMICKTVARGVHGSYLLVGTRIHKNVSTTLRRHRRVGILGNAKVMCYRLVGELPSSYPRPFPSLTTYYIGLIKTT